MRLLICFFLLVFCFNAPVMAQSSSIYNSNSRDGGSAIYNSKSSSRSRPINIKKLSNGARKNRTTSRAASSSYGLGNNRQVKSIFSRTPDEVRADRARDIKVAAERARQIERGQGISGAVVNVGRINERTNRSKKGSVRKTRRKSVYLNDRNTVATPKRVFNTTN